MKIEFSILISTRITTITQKNFKSYESYGAIMNQTLTQSVSQYFIHYRIPHTCILTLSQLIEEYEYLQPMCKKINNTEQIILAYQTLIRDFDTFDENMKRDTCFSIQMLKVGLITILQAEDELDLIKLSEGNSLVKEFLKRVK